MQFRQKLWPIGFIAGLFLVIVAGHRLSRHSDGRETAVLDAEFPVDDVAFTFDPAKSLFSPAVMPPSPSRDSHVSGLSFDPGQWPAPHPLTTAHAEVTTGGTPATVPARFDPSEAKPLDAEIAPPGAPQPRDETVLAQNESNRPSKIARPEDASPLKSSRGEFDNLFEEEWPDASREERDIWSQQFRGVAPETLRDLLRLRQHHSIDRSNLAGPRLPGRDDSFSSGKSRNRAPAFSPGSHLPAVDETVAVLRQVQSVTLQNLLHAQTPGYKARMVNYADRIPAEVFSTSPRGRRDVVPYEDDAGVISALDQRINIRPGSLRETNRAFDVAIAGRGWFCVTYDGQTYYTRNGAWSLTESRMLALRVVGHDYIIEPAIIVPENISQVIFTPQGEVLGKTEPRIRPQLEPGDAIALGTIAIFGFLDESQLVPINGSLYTASASAGTPVDLTTGDNTFGELKQGFLEDANVNIDRETEHWERLQRFQQMFVELHSAATLTGSRRTATEQR